MRTSIDQSHDRVGQPEGRHHVQHAALDILERPALVSQVAEDVGAGVYHLVDLPVSRVHSLIVLEGQVDHDRRVLVRLGADTRQQQFTLSLLFFLLIPGNRELKICRMPIPLQKHIVIIMFTPQRHNRNWRQEKHLNEVLYNFSFILFD